MYGLTFARYEGEMLDGQPHGNGSIVYMANDKFGRANYTGIRHNIFRKIFVQTAQVFWSEYWPIFPGVIQVSGDLEQSQEWAPCTGRAGQGG